MISSDMYDLVFPTYVTPSALRFFPPGVVLSVSTGGAVEHFGMLMDRHVFGYRPTIISPSKKRGAVVEEFAPGFSGGAPILAHGPWGDLPWQHKMKIARANLGRPYHLFLGNCEHFVRVCSGLEPESPQLQKAFGGIALGGAALLILASLANT